MSTNPTLPIYAPPPVTLELEAVPMAPTPSQHQRAVAESGDTA